MAKGDADAARNEVGYQKSRYEGQVDPFLNTATGGYNRGVERAGADYSNLMGGYKKFADTGGISPSDIAAMRARSLSPIRAAYANAGNEISRQRSLQGGYSPNATAALAKMARERGQAMSDANTNVDASLADLTQKGKEFGLSGASSLYGTSPGMASTFGNQVLQAIMNSGQQGSDYIKNRINIGMMPSGWDNFMKAMGGIGSIATMGGI